MLYLWTYMQSLGSSLRSDIEGLGSSLKNEERGATMVEYGLIVAAIALIVVVAAFILGGAVANLFNNAANKVNSPG